MAGLEKACQAKSNSHAPVCTTQRAFPRGESHHAFASSLLHVTSMPVCRVSRKLSTRVARDYVPTDLPPWVVHASCLLVGQSGLGVESRSGNDTTIVTSNWASSILHDPSLLPQSWLAVTRTNSFKKQPHIAVPRVTTHLSGSKPKQVPTSCCYASQHEHVHPTVHMHLAINDLHSRIRSLATFGPASYRSRCKCSRKHSELFHKRLGQ